MMKNFKLSSLIFLLLLFCVGLQAQVIPVDWSYINAGNAGNISNATVTIDESTGDFYQIGVHTATAMATTDGTVVSGSGRKGPNTDISISKYDSQGNLIYRTSLGGTGFENDPFVVTRNGLLYILGRTGSSDFPVNDGSSLTLTTSGFSFQSQDLFLTIFDPTGNIVKSSYIGGNGADVSNGLELSDNRLMVSLSTYSTDLPVTNGSSFAGGTSADVAYFALDLNGNILAGTYLGGTLTESLPQMRRVGGKYFATFRTNSGTSFVTTDGSVAPTSTAAALVTLDDNMNVIESKVIGGDFGLNGYDMEVDDDYIYISMGINGGGYPQTTGPSSPVTSAGTDMHVSKFDHDLTLVYGELFTSVGTEYNSSIEVENGNAYVVFTTPSNTLPTTGNPSEANPSTGFGSQASHDYYAMKINSSNTVEYSTYLGGSEDERVTSRFSTAVFGGELYVVFGTTSSNEVSTDGSLPYGTSAVDGAGDIIFYQLDAGGNDKKLEYLGGSHVDYDATLYVRECEILLGYSHRHPATSLPTSFDSGVSRFYGRSNEVLVRYALDPQFTITNEITPNNQAPCLNGLVDVLNGNAITSDDGRYNASYQWQESIDGEITWADIPGAILKNYAPQTSPDDKHYRRLVYDRVSCTESLVSTSNSAFIEGSSILATELDAGGVLYVCANDPVRIGGNPTATNTTTSDFTYDWDMGLMLNDSTIANPIATVSESTVITLLVTDGNGCVSADQVVINVPIADAGPDRETCEGIGKQIGTPGLPVISGVTYLWSSPSGVADLDCYTCAQTLAEPLVQTTYTLSVTVPSQNGGLPCVLTDNVVVTPVTEPVADFAGPDQIICYTSNANLGLPAESGYEYTWAPGNYLYSNDEAEVVYNSGSDYPDPNPFTYYLTAVYGECSFTDEVVV
ncbi:MAG: hypothetical protein ACPG5P_01355, partial [Saprospiraceae bacterium]